MDDPFCNIRLLEEHGRIVARTPAMYGANGGDSINNWVGRLERLYAEQSTTQTEAWEYVEWLLKGLGINWLIWLLGNHDVWNHGKRIFEGMNTARVLMRDWDARLNIVSPCGGTTRVWARHNFKGTSIYNELHGLKRAAMFTGMADILAAFHLHTFGYAQHELDNGECATLLRAKGYKDSDHYAVVNKFTEQRFGHSVVTIIQPRVGMQPLIDTFKDVETAADFLTFLRKKGGYA
jgi:hypothetical protein